MSDQHSPTWLIAAIDQRLALVNEIKTRSEFPEFDVIFIPLTEPPENATHKEFLAWDRGCDNCKKFCEHDLHTGHYGGMIGDQKVIVTFGCCSDCVRLP